MSNSQTDFRVDPDFALGVDLDGVVADYYTAIRPIAAEWLGVPIEDLTKDVHFGFAEWGLDPEQYDELHRFAVTQRDFFGNLKPMPGAAATLRRLGHRYHMRIRIVTHRLFTKHLHHISAQQTTQWLDSNGIPYWDL